MIQRAAFQTRARTVDHLGREQIADCPTAISELWKNAFDAYARNVELNIFDGDEPVAAIVDDGHGMSYKEFVQNWLVVGTESKTKTGHTPLKDRNGLKVRERQGQKGIGRLSCANLGPLLLLVSKRRQKPFVASLIDWRLFENPFINLSDILIPVIECDEFDQIFGQLSKLATSLSENITGGSDEAQKQRIKDAWLNWDELYASQDIDGNSDMSKSLSQEILSTMSRIPFAFRHFGTWQVASGDCDHGTALLVSNINYDLRVYVNEEMADTSAQKAKDRFFETLSSFVDPFVDQAVNHGISENGPEFSYAVRVWRDETQEVILGTEKQFDRRQVDGLEHRIEGSIDSDGVFKGQIRAFGEWLPDECVIEQPKNLRIPHRRDSELGPLGIWIASMEFDPPNTTHSKSEFVFYQNLAKNFAGFMLFRDGLRVLPYGRTDNDFFEIESRRTKSAGREFWNHRQMFGRIAITRKHNPNLKDKAGREGLLDNRAAKTLKGLVDHILMQSARLYFGSASELRKTMLPKIKDKNARKRATEERDKLRKRYRREFQTKLNKYSRILPVLLHDIQNHAENLNIETETQISEERQLLASFRSRLSDLLLPNPPGNLGPLEDDYIEYQAGLKSGQSTLANIEEEVEYIAENIESTQPKALLKEQLGKQLTSQSAQIRSRIGQWFTSIRKLQIHEYRRIDELVKQRKEIFPAEATPLLHRFETNNMTFAETSKVMDVLKQQTDEANREMFVSYISALESLQESIDLEHLATFGMEEVGELRTELERLNSLAQLGIAVEIMGHELQSYDDIIGSGLKRLPEEARRSAAAKDIEFGYEGLTDQLRFLSPLRLAGRRIQLWITGSEIFEYLEEFFKFSLVKNKISVSASDSFRRFRIFDQRSRIYPVFINLLNNSVYWLAVGKNDNRRIVFDVVDSEIVLSDNGPGVSPEDVDSLFSLFFTRKTHGGRGVGLYLCRANLTAGGHSIRYEPSTKNMPLQGANFLISFRGAEFDGD